LQNLKDIRWQQRFENFEKAFFLLRDVFLEKEYFSNLEKEGIVQRFEFTFELAWKTIKDYLESTGLEIATITPKNIIKEAFSAKIIMDGEIWIDMLEKRNDVFDDYSEIAFSKTVKTIQIDYLKVLNDLYVFLKRITKNDKSN
jgi:nucleotidyltransferase substrate binding protein (TIGR01987 family)